MTTPITRSSPSDVISRLPPLRLPLWAFYGSPAGITSTLNGAAMMFSAAATVSALMLLVSDTLRGSPAADALDEVLAFVWIASDVAVDAFGMLFWAALLLGLPIAAPTVADGSLEGVDEIVPAAE